MSSADELFEQTPNAKLISLRRYRDQISDVRTSAYRVIGMATELRRPVKEMEALLSLLKMFDDGWWSLKHDIVEAEEASKKR